MTAAATKPEVEMHETDAGRELDARRRHITEALSTRPGKDLADLSDAEFQEGRKRLKTVQERMKVILADVLVENAHFGNPKDSRGKLAFKKPILFKAGAEELRRFMRLTLRRVAEDEIVSSAELVSVVVTLGIFDAAGRLIATRRAACTTKERRFKTYDGSGWTYDDAREKLHDCLAMAEKRAGSLLTCEVSGATAFFANAEIMDDALEDDKPVTPWTADEKKRVYEAAAKKRMSRKEIGELVEVTLGRPAVGSGDDVELLLAAIAQWTRQPKAEDEPASAASAPKAAEPQAPEPGDAKEPEELPFK